MAISFLQSESYLNHCFWSPNLYHENLYTKLFFHLFHTRFYQANLDNNIYSKKYFLSDYDVSRSVVLSEDVTNM